MPEAFSTLVPLVGIALLFWLLIIRPASRRQKELGRMQSSLKTGDEVMLTSGVFGILRDTGTETDAEHVRVEIAEGVTIKVARGAIGSIAQSAHDESAPDQPAHDQPGLASDEPEEN